MGKENLAYLGFFVIVGLTVGGLVGLNYVFNQSNGQTSPSPSIPETLQETIEVVERLDQRYNGSWHEEKLGGAMIKLKAIPTYLEDINALYLAIAEKNSSHANVSLDFLDARRRMLVSQDLFQRALKGGTKGRYDETFTCRDRQALEYYTSLYNESVTAGQPFFRIMDRVLRTDQDAPKLIGLDEEKPKFYYTKFGDILRLVEVNRFAIRQRCDLGKSFEQILKESGVESAKVWSNQG